MKEILLYSGVYSYTASQFINELEANKGSDITIRVNTPGGDVYAAYGMIAKFQEHVGKKKIKVDGVAASAGAFLTCYADDVESLDVSEFLFHRAAYPSYIESDERYFTPEKRASLQRINEALRSAMESKVTSDKWKEVTGISLDDIFSLDQRIDVLVTAEQAKSLGLVSRINKITPEKRAEIEALSFASATASMASRYPTIEPEKANPKTVIKMTLEQLKAEHPTVYAQALKEGVEQERDRVSAFLAFLEFDTEGVSQAIKDGSAMTQKHMAEFSVKAVTAAKLQAIEAKSPAEVPNPIPGAGGTNENPAMAAFENEVDGLLGIGK